MKKVIVVNEAGIPTGIVRFLEEATVEGGDDVTVAEFDISKCSTDIQRRLALHGASQKIGDSYAGANKTDDPKAFARLAVEETIEQLYNGPWRQNAGGGGGTRVSDFVLVLSEVSGQTVEAAEEFAASLTPEQVKAYKADAVIASKLKARAAQRAVERAQKATEAANAAAAKAGTTTDQPKVNLNFGTAAGNPTA